MKLRYLATLLLALFFLASCDKGDEVTDIGNPDKEQSLLDLEAEIIWGNYELVPVTENLDHLVDGIQTSCSNDPEVEPEIKKTEIEGELNLLNFLDYSKGTKDIVVLFEEGPIPFQVFDEDVKISCEATFTRLDGFIYFALVCTVHSNDQEECALLLKHIKNEN